MDPGGQYTVSAWPRPSIAAACVGAVSVFGPIERRRRGRRLRRRSRARGEAGIRVGHHAGLQRRPAGIGGGVAAERKDRRRNLRRGYRAVKRLGVHKVAVTYGQSVDLIAAVELHGAGVGTAPSSDDRAENCTGGRVYRDHMRAEKTGDSRRRSWQGERISWQHAAANGTYVDQIRRRGVENAQPRSIIVA